jgi:hypothetical protein
MKQKSLTIDETGHAPAAITEMYTGSHVLIHDHPPFFRYLLGAPLLLYKPNIPYYAKPWEGDHKRSARYRYGKLFYFRCNNDADKLIFTSRMVVVIFAIFLGLFVIYFSSQLFGKWAGLFALFIYIFDPNILAHSRIAKNDLFLTFFIFLTFVQLFNYLKESNRKNFLLLGIFLGLSLSSKYSALMLIPIFFIYFFISYFQKTKYFFFSIIKSLSASFLLLLIASILVIIFYNLFPFNQKRFEMIFGKDKTYKEYKIPFIKKAKESWYNLSQGQNHLKTGHYSYLMGKTSLKGWLHYFPIAFSIKNPIPLLLFFLWSFIFFLKFHKNKKFIHFFLLSFVFLYFLIISIFGLNIGYRYLLPIHPCLAVYISSLIPPLIKSKKIKLWILFCILSLWYIYGTLKIYPHYLAYFNEFIGGPDKGSFYLVDSNLDWGQDLIGLKQYLDQNKIDSIYLAYFGTDDPEYRKISYKTFDPNNLKPGYYAISATRLRGVYHEMEKPDLFKKFWNLEPIAKIGYSIFIYKID